MKPVASYHVPTDEQAWYPQLGDSIDQECRKFHVKHLSDLIDD